MNNVDDATLSNRYMYKIDLGIAVEHDCAGGEHEWDIVKWLSCWPVGLDSTSHIIEDQEPTLEVVQFMLNAQTSLTIQQQNAVATAAIDPVLARIQRTMDAGGRGQNPIM